MADPTTALYAHSVCELRALTNVDMTAQRCVMANCRLLAYLATCVNDTTRAQDDLAVKLGLGAFSRVFAPDRVAVLRLPEHDMLLDYRSRSDCRPPVDNGSVTDPDAVTDDDSPFLTQDVGGIKDRVWADMTAHTDP